jgi:hypothetical protein
MRCAAAATADDDDDNDDDNDIEAPAVRHWFHAATPYGCYFSTSVTRSSFQLATSYHGLELFNR